MVLPVLAVVAVNAEYTPQPATLPITPTTRSDSRVLRAPLVMFFSWSSRNPNVQKGVSAQSGDWAIPEWVIGDRGFCVCGRYACGLAGVENPGGKLARMESDARARGRSPTGEWWLRVLTVLTNPVSTFLALRDDSDEEAGARAG